MYNLGAFGANKAADVDPYADIVFDSGTAAFSFPFDEQSDATAAAPPAIKSAGNHTSKGTVRKAVGVYRSRKHGCRKSWKFKIKPTTIFVASTTDSQDQRARRGALALCRMRIAMNRKTLRR